jgi:hypothetical protein
MTEENLSQSTQSSSDSVKKRISGKLIGIIVGGITFVLATVAISFAIFTGGGNQPEDVLPRDTVAIAKIDLNPRIGQRINLVRFLSKFPKAIENFNQEDPVGSILEQSDVTSGLDWEEIKPWIGNRYAVALVESAGNLNPVLAISIKDQLEMEYFFKKNYPDLSIAVILDYLLIAQDKSVLNVITSAPTHLSDNEDYKSDMDTLGGDQIASVWVNLKPITKIADSSIREFLYNQGIEQNQNPLENTNGRIAVGMHFTSDTFVTDLITVDVNEKEVKIEEKSRSLQLIGDLPSDLFGVLSIDGLGKALDELLLSNSLVGDLLETIEVSVQDIRAIFEGPFAVIAVKEDRSDSDPLYLVRVEPTNSAQTLTALQRILSQSGYDPRDFDSYIRSEGKYIYLSTDSTNLQRAIGLLNSGATPLQEDDQFKKTLPEAGNVSLFVNLSRVLPEFDINVNDAPLGALGISIGPDSSKSGVSRTKITLSLKSD